MSSIFTRKCLSHFDCKAHKLSCNNIVACFMTSYHRLPNWQVLLQIWLPFFFSLVTMVTKNSCNLECCSDQICLLKQFPALAYHCVLFINFFTFFLNVFFLFQGGEVIFITFSDEFPLPDNGDFYMVFEGKKQRHVTTAQQINTFTLRAIVPGTSWTTSLDTLLLISTIDQAEIKMVIDGYIG